jgi:Tol biopolymer transport system component/DNA-binding winged helix-turn-helix (wHTH) protein
LKLIYEFESYRLDAMNRVLLRSGSPQALPPKVFDLLLALVERHGRLVDKSELMGLVWPDTAVEDSSLSYSISILRKTLGSTGDSLIETVPKYGYRFVAPVRRVDAGKPPEAVAPIANTRMIASLADLSWSLGAALGIGVAAVLAFVVITVSASRSSPDKPLTVVPLITELGRAAFPSFSADGNQVAFQSSQGHGGTHIFIKMIGPPRDAARLTAGSQPEYCPAWAPDGQLIAFVRQIEKSRYGVVLVPGVGGQERQLLEFIYEGEYLPGSRFRLLEWTPDARHLLISLPESADNFRLFLVSIEDGQRAPIIARPAGGPMLWERSPAISRDGRRLAFSAGLTLDAGDIYVVELTKDLRSAGAPRRLTWEDRAGRFAELPAWTPDGREIVYSSSRDGSPRLWRIGVQPGAIARQVPSVGPDTSMAAISQQGRLVYWHGHAESGIWRQEISPVARRESSAVPLIASTGQNRSPEYSPDGKHIAFTSDRTGNKEIWICESDGAHCRQLTSFSGSVAGIPRWSPDGREIAFNSSAAGQFDVYTIDSDGGRPHRLTDNAADDALPSWSRNGKWIYFTSFRTGRYEIWKVPSHGGAAVQVTRNGGFNVFESSDGNIYYTKVGRNSRIWRSPLDGTVEYAVTDAGVMRDFVVTASRLYYLRPSPAGTSTLRSFEFATAKDVSTATFTGPLDLGLSLSPDGRYVLYSQLDHVGTNLMLVENFQ